MTRDDIIDLWSKANGWSIAEYPNTLADIERFVALVIKAHTQQVINDPAEIRRVFEIDEADYPPPDSGFAKL